MNIKNFSAAVLIVTAVIFVVPAKAQVTIGAQTPPHSTLEVVKLTGSTMPDGIMAPQIEGADLKTADAKYGTAQNGALIFALSASPDAGAAGAKTLTLRKRDIITMTEVNGVWVAVGSGGAQ